MGLRASQSDRFRTTPVIDMAPLRSGIGAPGGRRCAARSREPRGFRLCAQPRRGRGGDRAGICCGRAFFALPDDEKLRVAVDRRHRGWLGAGGARMHDDARPDPKESFNWALEWAPNDPHVGLGKPLLGPNNWPEASTGGDPRAQPLR